MKLPTKKPEHFCIAPFQSIRQNPYGKNSPCAFGAGEWDHAHLTPKERWHSRELQALRQEFADGRKPSVCSRCWDEEAAGKKSLRQRNLEYFPDDYENFIQNEKWLAGPKTAVFKTSNICNLACRSCAGWDSSLYTREGQHYLKEYQTTVEHNGQKISHNRFISLKNPLHLDFSQYKEISENLLKIDFFGGEPFLNTSHLELLQHLVNSERSSEVTLFYSTNASLIPSEKLIELWKVFKEVQISFSIDGIEKSYEYTRWPAHWEQAQKVIHFFKELKKSQVCQLMLMGSFTISSINCSEADILTQWHQEQFGHYYINMVQSPDYLAIHTLPEKVKEFIRANVKNPEVLGYLDIHQPNALKFKQFIIWMKRQDLYRQQSFAEVYPQYQQIFAEQWNSVHDISEKNFYSLS